MTRRERSSTLSKILVAVGMLIVLAAATYSFGRFSSGDWSLVPTPTFTQTMTSTRVMPTETVFIPSDTPTTTSTPTRSIALSYTVLEGDNLSYISNEHDIEIDALVAYNLAEGIDLTGGILQPNQEILIPPPSFKATAVDICPTSIAPGAIIQHKIRPGDILQSLADECSTTLDAILLANEGLSDNPNLLMVGDVIEIPVGLLHLTPSPPPSPTRVSRSTAIPTQ